MNNGKRTNITKGNGGSGRRRTNLRPDQIVCKFDTIGCKNPNCRYAHTRQVVPYASRQMVPAGNQMVASGGHLEQAGNGFAQSLNELCNYLVAPIQKRLDEVEQTARGAAVDAIEAKKDAASALQANQDTLASIKADMEAREKRETERERREAERETEREAKRKAEAKEQMQEMVKFMMQMNSSNLQLSDDSNGDEDEN